VPDLTTLAPHQLLKDIDSLREVVVIAASYDGPQQRDEHRIRRRAGIMMAVLRGNAAFDEVMRDETIRTWQQEFAGELTRNNASARAAANV